MSFFDDIFGGGGDSQTTTQNDYRPAPEYAEAEGARGKWWETLQSWAGQPGYGAIAPNWGDIWSNARGKLSRQYWGGPEGPGAVAKVKASAARRGVSDSPALQATIGRMGMQEGNQLMDMAIQQAIAEANLGESGRKTWLGSVQNLASQKPQMLNYGSTSTKQMIPNPVGDVVGGLGELAVGGGFDIMDLFGGGSGVNTGDQYGGGSSGLGSADDDGYDWMSAILGGARGLSGDPTGWAQLAGTFF